jgi:hypothetical protein
MAGVPTRAAAVVAASSPAHKRRIRPDITGSFHGGHLPPPLLRYTYRPRIIRPPRPRRRLVMIQRRLTRALLSIGVAGGLLLGLFGLNLQADNRTDIVVLASEKSFVGPADDAFFVDLGAIFDGVNL